MLSILIVDDETPVREWVEYCISRVRDRFTIIGLAASGEEALGMIRKKTPEVVIADISMPGMDGLELMRQVKGISPYTAFVIMTNYAEFSYAKKAITYGAKEYLLKSEMCADDLIAVLDRIHENKERIVESKVEDQLPNGLIDLFALYQNREEKTREEFWEKLGLEEDAGYRVLCTRHGAGEISPEKWRLFADDENLSHVFPATRNEYDFIILEDCREKKLEASVNRIAAKVGEKYEKAVGISGLFAKRRDLIKGLGQAEEAENYRFFSPETRVFLFEELVNLKALDFEKVRADFQKILMDLTYKKFGEALEEIGEWFSMIEGIRIQDSQWAMERCQRMVIAVEEQYYHLDPSGEEQARGGLSPGSAEECEKRCRDLLRRLFDKKNGAYSESIERALSYIHQNFGSDLSLVDVAKHIYRSPEYFSRLFKDEVGENFSTYLMICRLNHARELLQNTDRKISDISCAVGYSTQSYFSRLYKKYMGKTPDEERSQKKPFQRS